MKLDPSDIETLARRAEAAGGKVLGVSLPGAGPVPSDFRNGTKDAPCRQEFTVHGWKPPTLNQLMRGRLATRMRLGKAARLAVGEACREASIYHAFRVKRRVSLEITLSGRQQKCDVDAPWKATLDALKHAGAIVDDSAKFCALGEVTFLRGDRTSTRIILEDLMDSPDDVS
jgi:Holliday junction resolvase RusA-like endonuclease